jgi:hypothetical protein
MDYQKKSARDGNPGALEVERCNEQHRSNSKAKPHAQPIRCELAWSDTATARGIVARGYAPVLNLCRQLVDAGHDPLLPLDAWRGGTLCLHVRSIGEAAGLRVNTSGTGFALVGEPTAAPSMRLKTGLG